MQTFVNVKELMKSLEQNKREEQEIQLDQHSFTCFLKMGHPTHAGLKTHQKSLVLNPSSYMTQQFWLDIGTLARAFKGGNTL